MNKKCITCVVEFLELYIRLVQYQNTDAATRLLQKHSLSLRNVDDLRLATLELWLIKVVPLSNITAPLGVYSYVDYFLAMTNNFPETPLVAWQLLRAKK